MIDLLDNVKMSVHESLFLKDPNSTDLGRKIVTHAVLLMDEIGLEEFNFKKLAHKIGTTEASIYRYFENKHKLLLYLINWYWSWLEYMIIFSTANINNPKEQLRKIIKVVAHGWEMCESRKDIDMKSLFHLVNLESNKIFRVKDIDKENKEGFYRIYKRLCNRVADILQKIQPNYDKPLTLATLILDGIHHQNFYAEKLPALTNIQDPKQELSMYFYNLTIQALQTKNN